MLLIFFGSKLICAALLGPQLGAWQHHGTRNEPNVRGTVRMSQYVVLLHLYIIELGNLIWCMCYSASGIRFPLVLNKLRSAHAASLDSHAFRGLRSTYKETRVTSNYVLLCYHNCTSGTNAGGYCTVRHERQRPRLEGFAMSLPAGPSSPMEKVNAKGIFCATSWE